MHQCIWKGTPIIGTYVGRETILPTPGTCSKMIFLIGFKELQKMKLCLLDNQNTHVDKDSH